jgi:hypothetical protein
MFNHLVVVAVEKGVEDNARSFGLGCPGHIVTPTAWFFQEEHANRLS